MNDFCSLFLVHVFQVTIVATIVWAVVRAAGQNRPHLAHALWILVLLKCVTPPIFSSLTSPFSWYNTPRQAKVAVQTSVPSSSKAASTFGPAEPKTASRVFEFDAAQPIARNSEPPKAATTPVAIPRAFPWSKLFQFAVLACLAIGSLLFLIQMVRLVLFWRRVKGFQTATTDRAQSIIEDVRSRLGVRRSVKALVVCGPIGPAVVGLVRPTILLPESILNSNDDEALALMIAHELIHIRRGDLWWALLQAISGSLFWFHPIVRLAVQATSNECERSCDEETVASMGCRPADYARVLLNIMEEKQHLRFASVLPGIKPVEVTSSRLERIMKLRHGSHKRTPWWAWAVLIVSSCTLLPGAGLAIGQANMTTRNDQLLSERESGIGSKTSPQPDTDEPLSLVSYDVDEILDQLQQANPAAEPQEIELHLLKWVKRFTEALDLSPEEIKRRSIKIVDGKLLANRTISEHKSLRSLIASYKKHGILSVLFEVRILNSQSDKWQARHDWKPIENSSFLSGFGDLCQTNPIATQAVSEDEFGNRKTENRQWHSKINPAKLLGNTPSSKKFQLAGEVSNTRQVRAATLSDSNSRQISHLIRQLPTAENYLTQSIVSDNVFRPFVTGVAILESSNGSAVQPAITALAEGTEVAITPLALNEKNVNVSVDISLSQVLDVKTKTFKSKNISVQVPQVSVRRIELSTEIQDAQTLAIQVPSSSKSQAGLIFLLTPRILVPQVKTINRTSLGNPTPQTNAPKLHNQSATLTHNLPPARTNQLDDEVRLASWNHGVEVTQADMDKLVKKRAAKFGMTVKQFVTICCETKKLTENDCWNWIKREVSIAKLPSKIADKFLRKSSILVPDAIVFRHRHGKAGLGKFDKAKTIVVNENTFIILADVNFSPSVDGVRIRGSHLLVEDTLGHKVAAADKLTMVINKHDLEFELTGRAQFTFDTSEPAEADYIYCGQGGTNLILRGNAKMVLGALTGSADEISVSENADILKFFGNAKVEMDDFEPPKRQGNEIKWNLDSGSMCVDGVEIGEYLPSGEGQTVPSAYYLDDDIQYFPQHSEESQGVVVPPGRIK